MLFTPLTRAYQNIPSSWHPYVGFFGFLPFIILDWGPCIIPGPTTPLLIVYPGCTSRGQPEDLKPPSYHRILQCLPMRLLIPIPCSLADPDHLSRLRLALHAEIQEFMLKTYSPNTTLAYSTHRRSYLAFCSVLGIPPVPADPVGLCLYAAILARTLKYTSIKQYMNIFRILHLEWGLPNPLANNYQLSCVLRGIRRHIGDRPHRKTPLTPQLLLQFLTCLDLSGLADCALWAAMLLAFYGLLQIGSMLCGSLQCDHSRHVTLADVQLHCRCPAAHCPSDKNNTICRAHACHPLPRVPGNVLCPSQALTLYLQRATLPSPLGESPLPLFVTSPSGKPLTAPAFASRVWDLAHLTGNVDSALGGHSFRRCGACLAYQLGIPVDTIRSLGDWASNAYTAYVLPERPLVANAILRMVKNNSWHFSVTTPTIYLLVGQWDNKHISCQ